jgi:hypothetical protein
MGPRLAEGNKKRRLMQDAIIASCMSQGLETVSG